MVPQLHVRGEAGLDHGVEAGGSANDELVSAVFVEHPPKAPFAVLGRYQRHVPQHLQQQVAPLRPRRDGHSVKVAEHHEAVGLGQ